MDWSFTEHTSIVVTLFRAHVAATRQVFFTERVAYRNRFYTRLSFPTEQLLNFVMTRWAELNANRVSLARLASAGVTSLLAHMMATFKIFVAYTLTRERLCSTDYILDLFLAMTLFLNNNITGFAWTFMTIVFAFVL